MATNFTYGSKYSVYIHYHGADHGGTSTYELPVHASVRMDFSRCPHGYSLGLNNLTSDTGRGDFCMKHRKIVSTPTHIPLLILPLPMRDTRMRQPVWRSLSRGHVSMNCSSSRYEYALPVLPIRSMIRRKTQR